MALRVVSHPTRYERQPPCRTCSKIMPSSGASSGALAHDRGERLGGRGLDQEIVETRVTRAQARGRVRIAGERHEVHADAGDGPQASRRLVTVDAGQSEI